MQTNTTSEFAWLADPVASDDACGVSLDGSSALADLDAHRVFGLLTTQGVEPDWRAVRTQALAALRTSRDLRALAHLVAAQLRTGTLIEALPLFALIHTWLERYWIDVHPRIDDD